MKKFLIFFVFFMFEIVYSPKVYTAQEVIPRSVITNNLNTIGLYQIVDNITVYKEHSENSDIIYSAKITDGKLFPEDINAKDLFLLYMPSKHLGLISVTDETDDWIEVIYDIPKGSKGWIKNDDPYKFMTWLNFYNMYGRKYGLMMLKGIPETVKTLHVSTSDTSQTAGTINIPQKINLNAIKGNWALVSVFDIDKTAKTGYVRWRSDDGIKYFFPAIK